MHPGFDYLSTGVTDGKLCVNRPRLSLSSFAGDRAHAFYQALNLFNACVTGAARTDEPLPGETEPLDDRRRIKIAVR